MRKRGGFAGTGDGYRELGLPDAESSERGARRGPVPRARRAWRLCSDILMLRGKLAVGYDLLGQPVPFCTCTSCVCLRSATSPSSRSSWPASARQRVEIKILRRWPCVVLHRHRRDSSWASTRSPRNWRTRTDTTSLRHPVALQAVPGVTSNFRRPTRIDARSVALRVQLHPSTAELRRHARPPGRPLDFLLIYPLEQRHGGRAHRSISSAI